MLNVISQEQKINKVFTNAQIRNYRDYMALPETIQSYEIIDGKVIMAPSPTVAHQWLGGSLYYALYRYVTANKLGHVFFAPLDVQISENPLRTRQPDVLFISTERSGFTGIESIRGLQLLEVAPELVVEILSPSDTRKMIAEKLSDYQKIGVQECWMISAEAETVEVLKLETDNVERIDIFGVGDQVRSEVLPELILQVDEIFV